MIFRPSREKRGPDPFLPHKMFIMLFGGALGLAGMAFQLGWLVYTAVGVLAIVFVLDIVNKRRSGK